jgi:hypothetical protein
VCEREIDRESKKEIGRERGTSPKTERERPCLSPSWFSERSRNRRLGRGVARRSAGRWRNLFLERFMRARVMIVSVDSSE